MAKATEIDAPEPTVALTFEQIKELMAAGRETPEEKFALLEKQAELNAKAHQKLTRPENPQHPGKGVFAYPEGEVARPKPKLRCKMTWGGTDEIQDLLIPEECELLNQIEPGVFLLKRGDGAPIKVEVVATRNEATNAYERIDVKFITRGALRHNLSSKVDMLKQIIAQQAPRSAASLAG